MSLRNRKNRPALCTSVIATCLAMVTLAESDTAAADGTPGTTGSYSTRTAPEDMPRDVAGFSVGVGLGRFFGIDEVDEIAGLERDGRGFVAVDDVDEVSFEFLLDIHYGWRALCPFSNCASGPYVALNANGSGVRTHTYGWSIQFPSWSIGIGRGTRVDVLYIPDEPGIADDGTPEVRKDDFSALLAILSARF